MQLIKIENTTMGQEVKETVNARELHSFLEVSTRFNDWIVSRINDFGFVEDQDFTTFTENPVKGRPAKEYALSLDMAKELSMVERNEKGKQARQYFIECERRAKYPVQALNNPALLKQLLLANLATVEEQKIQIEHRDKMIAVIAPKADIADLLVISDGLYNLTHAAKILNQAPRKFNKDLNAKGWIYRMGVSGDWTGYSEKIKAGYLEHKMCPFNHSDGTPDTKPQVKITAKGMHKLAQIFGVKPEYMEEINP